MTLPLLLAAFAFGADPVPPKSDPAPVITTFERYTVKDSLDRTVTFYLSKPSDDRPLPVALLVQGSGCQSLFRKDGERVLGGMQNLLRDEAKGKARVLIVEKPGVQLFDVAKQPGSAIGASEEFLKEHTLPRWTEANVAAVKAAWTLPGIDATKTLVVGHSEGGIVVARVAAELPTVTHVASLAGGGPNQLFSLMEPRPGESHETALRRAQSTLDAWANVLEKPESWSTLWLGHPHRRWTSFLKSSVIEELVKSKAKIFLAQGSLDMAVPPTGHDVAVAELKARGRDVTAVRIEGGDHGFRTADQPAGSPEGLKKMFGQVLEWFLAGKP